MYAATTSVALVGGDAKPVEVQVHVGRQKDEFKLSGLPDTAVREAKDRVRAAVVSSGLDFPNRTVTVNLAPAHVPKAGTDYDLAIAIGVLAASGVIPKPTGTIVVGELALDGTVRPSSSSLGAGVLSARTGSPALVANRMAPDTAAVPGSTVFGVSSLADAVDCLRGGLEQRTAADPSAESPEDVVFDLEDIRGQLLARRALEIAAAGGHHVLFHGPPGGGKTMLARRLPGILPPLSDEEAVEVSLMHSAVGRTRRFTHSRPFRSPHHTASRAALVGGGSGVPVPGEVSLAHRGVLFLDELAEFPRSSLDTLRQPLEDGSVTVARRGMTVRFPSVFQMVAASNPCPCGFYGDRRKPCECRPAVLSRYRLRVSGPLVDRVDLVVKVDRVEADQMKRGPGESSAAVRSRVADALAFRSTRPRSTSPEASQLVHRAMESGLVTARGARSVERVARTIADLALQEVVDEACVAEALGLRGEF